MRFAAKNSYRRKKGEKKARGRPRQNDAGLDH